MTDLPEGLQLWENGAERQPESVLSLEPNRVQEAQEQGREQQEETTEVTDTASYLATVAALGGRMPLDILYGRLISGLDAEPSPYFARVIQRLYQITQDYGQVVNQDNFSEAFGTMMARYGGLTEVCRQYLEGPQTKVKGAVPMERRENLKRAVSQTEEAAREEMKIFIQLSGSLAQSKQGLSWRELFAEQGQASLSEIVKKPRAVSQKPKEEPLPETKAEAGPFTESTLEKLPDSQGFLNLIDQDVVAGTLDWNEMLALSVLFEEYGAKAKDAPEDAKGLLKEILTATAGLQGISTVMDELRGICTRLLAEPLEKQQEAPAAEEPPPEILEMPSDYDDFLMMVDGDIKAKKLDLTEMQDLSLRFEEYQMKKEDSPEAVKAVLEEILKMTGHLKGVSTVLDGLRALCTRLLGEAPVVLPQEIQLPDALDFIELMERDVRAGKLEEIAVLALSLQFWEYDTKRWERSSAADQPLREILDATAELVGLSAVLDELRERCQQLLMQAPRAKPTMTKLPTSASALMNLLEKDIELGKLHEADVLLISIQLDRYQEEKVRGPANATSILVKIMADTDKLKGASAALDGLRELCSRLIREAN